MARQAHRARQEQIAQFPVPPAQQGQTVSQGRKAQQGQTARSRDQQEQMEPSVRRGRLAWRALMAR